MIVSLLKNRNAILIIAVLAGLFLGEWAHPIKNSTLYILAAVMTLACSGIPSRALVPSRQMIGPFLLGMVFNYFIYGFLTILLTLFLVKDPDYQKGFWVIAAAPPGVAILPFSQFLKGDKVIALIGMVGGFVAAMVFSPFLITFLSGSSGINFWQLVWFMVLLILIPLLASRLLLIYPLRKPIELYRGKLVNWGFALIIFIAIGVNRQVFLSNLWSLWPILLVTVGTTFGLGFLHLLMFKKKAKNQGALFSQNLLLTVKTTGFSVATSLSLFGEKAAVPSAMMAIVLLLYLLTLLVKYAR